MPAEIGTLTLLIAAALYGPSSVLRDLPVRPAAALQFDGIVRQQSDHTCGFAAAATVLRSLGIAVDEASLVRAAGMSGGRGASVAAIGRAAAAWGVRSFAVRSTWEKLSRYFDRFSEPVVALVDAGRSHFTVVLGMDAGAVYLADPSQGYRTLSRRQFEGRWTGVLLFLRRQAESGREGGRSHQPLLVEALRGLRARHQRLLHNQAGLGILAGTARAGL